MKISKLFHWLYAVLMLLPVIALGSAILVNTFNQQAKQEQVEYLYKYETPDVTMKDDIDYGKVYHFTIDDSYIVELHNGAFGSDFDISVDILRFDFIGVDDWDSMELDETYLYASGTSFYSFVGYFSNDHIDCPGLYGNDDDSYVNYNLSYSQGFEFKFDGIIRNFNGNDYFATTYVSQSDFNEIVGVKDGDVTNVFYKAVEQIQSSPVFSWSYNSFLVAPFQYIMALFGMPSNHIVVELLSYWLAVSIIWLVFDLIMYVPLLAHRWLDKGILE